MCVRDRACTATFTSARNRKRSMKKEAKSEYETLLALLTISRASGSPPMYSTPPAFLAQRLARDRENMTSDGTKISVYWRKEGRECGKAGTAEQRLSKLRKAL